MDIQFYGANCLVLTAKGVRLVVDDNLVSLGSAKSVARDGDVVLCTGAHDLPKANIKLLIDQPGEYEVSGVSVYGIPARSHMDEEGQLSTTMYKIISGDLSVFVPGHIYPELSEKQLESIGMVDIMCVPVGGSGYTLDPIGALRVIKQVEPRLVIPTHYDAAGLKYPVPQQSLETALHDLGMEVSATLPRLKAKASELGDVSQLIVLEPS